MSAKTFSIDTNKLEFPRGEYSSITSDTNALRVLVQKKGMGQLPAMLSKSAFGIPCESHKLYAPEPLIYFGCGQIFSIINTQTF